MVGDSEGGIAAFREGGGFGAIEVAGDAAGWVVAVDGDEHEVGLVVDEQVGQVFPALAQYDYAPVRGETLAHLLEEGSNG